MNKTDVLNIFSAEYAKEYNDRFLLEPLSKVNSDFELSVLKELLSPQTKWLDVGCGTGYFLSQFPDIKRAGLDISPFMLEEAKRANPNAIFFKEGDCRKEYPEWNAEWNLVSCMWLPYTYFDSFSEFETLTTNMINWLSDGGDLLLPVMDIEDFRFGQLVTFEEIVDKIYPGKIQINGFIWSWIEEETKKKHDCMIAPHVEHVIGLMTPFFETVELIRYPPFQEGWVSRKAVLARSKTSNTGNGQAEVIRHPIPPPFHQDLNSKDLTTEPDAATSVPAILEPNMSDLTLSNRQLVGELFRRLKSGHLFRSVLRKIFNR
ncbi:MAG: class I SAM-dependent methyltransferase [Pyrinomonadaceae bacterium]